MKNVAKISVAVLLAAVLMTGAAHALTPLLKELEDAFIRLHVEVGPAVVNITVKGAPVTRTRDLPDFFRMYGIPGGPRDPGFQMPQPQSTGSGFIYDAEGHIVTNNHVVEDAESISVRLHNGNEYDAVIVGRDPDSDLAVIKIEAEEKLPVLKLGDSDKLKPGQFAIAVGSPRGFEGSLSFGHISALGREGLGGLTSQGLHYQHLIQTDAAINLGNSGGPLCNIDGEVIGINLAIIYGANNIGFAIPVNTAKHVIPALIKYGRVSRGFIGVKLQILTQDIAEDFGMPDRKGALIAEVLPGQPGEKAGLRPYDVIRKIDGDIVEDLTDLQRKVGSHKPGDSISLEIWRDEGVVLRNLELAELTRETRTASWPRGAPRKILGMRVETLSPEIAERMGLEEDVEGVVLTEVLPGSPAEEAGLRHGDIISEIGKEPVSNPAEFRARVDREGRAAGKLLVRYLRGGSWHITVIDLPDRE